MCTLSWLQEDEGYALWFNRDELNTRAAEIAPRERETDRQVAWLAPEDPDSGGTWLMVNAYGVCTVLLNDYRSPPASVEPAGRQSRGRLVPLTVAARSAEEAMAMAGSAHLQRTPPFHLVALDAEGQVAQLHWDGVARHRTAGAELAPPLTSSSVQTEAIIRRRIESFPRAPSPLALRAYHHAHDPSAGAQSVNMCRADACTRSISAVRVSGEWASLEYEPQGWMIAPLAARSRQRLARLQPSTLTP